MALTPITKRAVPDDVFDQLLEEVVDGSLSAGDTLPSERRLAELLGVSRPAVREALQRLSVSRLIEVRQGGATTVRDYLRHAGLDLLPRLLVRDGDLDPAVARSIVEARLHIGPEVARLAAGRAVKGSSQAREALEQALQALVDAEDALGRQRAALAFWDAVVDLADSIVFRLMYNSLRQAYEPALEALSPLLEGEVSDLEGYRTVRTAILGGRPAVAAAACEALLRPSSEALVQFLDAIDDTDDERDPA